MAGFEKNGLYYEIIDEKKKHVNVRYASWYSRPTGALSIPSEVENDGKKYVVTEIGGKGSYERTVYNRVWDKRLKEGYRDVPEKKWEYWYGFSDCRDLTSVKIPESVTVIGHGAFRGCKNLSKITLPAKLVEIGEYAFDGCKQMTSIKLPDAVKILFRGAFRDSGLQDVNIPKGVEAIDEETFGWCKNLKKIVIPANVNIIRRGAFRCCDGLKEALIDNSDENLMIESDAFPKETKLIYKGKGLFSRLFGK